MKAPTGIAESAGNCQNRKILQNWNYITISNIIQGEGGNEDVFLIAMGCI